MKRLSTILLLLPLLLSGCARKAPVPVPVPSILTTIPATPSIVRFDASTFVVRPEAVLAELFKSGLYTFPGGVNQTDWTFAAQSGQAIATANYYTPYNWEDWPAYLDAAHALGMQLMLGLGEEIFTASAGTTLINQSVADHPALLCVIAFDEFIWNVIYNGFTGPYEATPQKWLDGLATWKLLYPNVKICAVEPYQLRSEPGGAGYIAQYYGNVDYPIIGQYGAPENTQREMALWMSSITGKPSMVVLQGFGCTYNGVGVPRTCIPRATVESWMRGAKDGAALAGLWWNWPASYQEATTINDSLWSDIVAVSKAYGEPPHRPAPAFKVFLPLIRKSS